LGEKVLGVLDVQSNAANALNTDDQLLLEGLCGQIAVAIDTTRLTSELQESSNFLNSIIDNIPNMVFVKEAQELRFVRMNKAGQAYFGASLEDIVGKNDHDFFPKEEADFFTGKDQEVLASGKPVSIPEETIESAFGPRILHTTKVPVLGADGEARYLLGISMDITERKQTEALLFDEQNRTRAILEAIGTPVVIANVTDGVLVYVNDPLAQLIGIPRQELIGRQTPDFFQNPADRQVYIDALRQHGQVANYEVMLKRGDGTPFWALMTGQISQFQGEAVSITSLIDITERQQAISAVQTNEALMRTIINATPDWIFIKDTEHRYQLVNQSYANTMKLAPEAFIGKNDIEIGFPEDIVKGNPEKGIRGFWADDQEIMASGEMKIIAEEPAVLDGEPRVLSTIKAPLLNSEGNVSGIVGFVHDITDMKQAQAIMAKQAQELQTVANLSTAVSTTLNTEQLLQEVVDRTKESFNLYHAHIYLLDETSGVLKLAAGAGEVGAQMVAAGYSIPADHPHSLVAQAAQSKQGVIVNNVAADPAFLPNPLLPDTKSEMAVPMIVGNKVVGVLDIQADTVDYFTHTDVNIQTTLAAQTAVALENARAFEQARQSTIIIDNTTNIIATMSLDQKILYLNNAGLRRLGYESLAELVDKPIGAIFPPGGEERRTPAVMAVQQHGFWRGESMLITKSGESFPVEQVITMIRDENGMPQMLIFNMTDITEQKEAELAQQALTAELEEQLERVNALQRAMTREGWQAYMTASKRPFQGFEFNQDGVKALIARDFIGGKNGKSQIAHTNGASQVVNPVKIHGATIGQIGARNANGEPLSDAQRELLAALTNQVAEALERARLSEQTQIALTDTEHREQELAILNAMAQSLTAQTTVEGVLAVVHEYTERLMASDEFYVAFFTAATNEIVFAYGVTEGRIIRNYGRRQAGKGLTEHVLTQRQPVLIASDIDKYLHEIGIEAIGRQAASWMGCPLQYGDQVIGLISLQSYTTPYAYDEQSLRLLSAIANQAAIAIENARLIEATDQRARQEQLLREVSAKVGAAVDAESVLQTAAREIGRALGLETFVYLKDPKKNQ
jgi:PAS domain S-box-containing protein